MTRQYTFEFKDGTSKTIGDNASYDKPVIEMNHETQTPMVRLDDRFAAPLVEVKCWYLVPDVT